MRAVLAQLILVIPLSLLACDADDPEAAVPPDGAASDVSEDAAPNVPADVAPDVVNDIAETIETPPCDELVCATPPAPHCSYDRAALVTPAPVGTCEEMAGEAVCTYAEAITDCAAGRSFCFESHCITEEQYRCDVPDTERRWSRVTTLAAGHQGDLDPETGEPPDACCFDFDGDGRLDNKLGLIFSENRALLGDLNALWQRQIDTGATCMIFEVRGLTDTAAPLSSPNVDVFGATTIAPPDGELGFERHEDMSYAFLPGTRIPRWVFAGAIEDGHLSGRGRAVIRTGNDGMGGHIELTLEDFRFEGEVALGPNGVGLDIFGDTERGARFGGLVPLRDLYELANKTVKHLCTCAVFEDGVEPIDVETGLCATPVSNTCSAAEAFCLALTEPLCTNLLGSLFVPDIDRDGDGTKDSLSAGLWMEATSAWVDLCDE